MTFTLKYVFEQKKLIKRNFAYLHTSVAASLIICLAPGLHIAGTVTIHRTLSTEQPISSFN